MENASKQSYRTRVSTFFTLREWSKNCEGSIYPLLVVEEKKNQVKDCKKSEAESQELVDDTLKQLKIAKTVVDTLIRSNGSKPTEDHNAIASELEQSRSRVNFLEKLVSRLEAEISTNAGDQNDHKTIAKKDGEEKSTELIEQLRSSLEVAEMRYDEERAQSRNAYEMVEKMKSEAGQREAELEAELRKSRYEIEELKSNLMDKEREIQSICEENDNLISHIELKENEALKLEIKKIKKGNVHDEVVRDLEKAKAAEREALMEVGRMREKVDESERKIERVTEELKAAQKGNGEMEAELRRLKVKCDQLRKAAEAAAAYMISAGSKKMCYVDCFDEDLLLKKRNAKMVRRFGVLWKKSAQK